jgi:hypothetical protein
VVFKNKKKMQLYYLFYLNYFLINYFVINIRAFPLPLFYPYDIDRDISRFNDYKYLKNNSLKINKITEGEIGVVIDEVTNKIINIQNEITGNVYLYQVLNKHNNFI